jgi:hypothetical protein
MDGVAYAYRIGATTPAKTLSPPSLRVSALRSCDVVWARSVPFLVGTFLLLLGIGWAFANPPGAGPDEGAHYVKAVGVGHGQLSGHDAPSLNEALRRALRTRVSPEQLEALVHGSRSAGVQWQRRTSRWFSLPAGLGFSAFGCGRLKGERWGSCLDQGRASVEPTERATYVGTYQPFVYAPPGIVMRTSGDPISALRLARLANAAISLGILLLAVVLLWDTGRGALSMVGLVAAVTPTVVFFGSVLNPTGPELAGSICFIAALLRLTRRPGAPAWVWAACAVAGAVLGLSRSLGPIFLVLAVGAVIALSGPGSVLSAVKAAPRAALVVVAVIVLAAAAGLWWELSYQPHVGSGPAAIVENLGPSLDQLPRMPKEVVGVFGVLDTFLPLSLYLAWWSILVILVVAAALVSDGAERLSLVAVLAAVVVVTLALSGVYRQTGFEIQARYVLPFAVLLPLWAGELLNRHRARVNTHVAGALLVGAGGIAGVVHVLAWYDNGRQVAVGKESGWRFISHADWVPPLGWWVWVAVVGCGGLALFAAGLVAARAVQEVEAADR